MREITAFCMKCKTNREMKNSQQMEKNGRLFLQGTCLDCGATIYSLLGRKKGEKKVEKKPISKPEGLFVVPTTPTGLKIDVKIIKDVGIIILAGFGMVTLGTPYPLLALLLLLVETKHFGLLLDEVVDIVKGVKFRIGQASKVRELTEREGKIEKVELELAEEKRQLEEKMQFLGKMAEEFERKVGIAMETISVDEVIRRMNLEQVRRDEFEKGVVEKATQAVTAVAKVAEDGKFCMGQVESFNKCIERLESLSDLHGEVVEISNGEKVEKRMKEKEVEIKPKEEPWIPPDIVVQRRKTAWNLKEIANMSPSQIARILEVSESTVDNYLREKIKVAP